MTSILWRGAVELENRFAKAAAAAPIGLAASLYIEGLSILAETIPITPIDKGPLRASGRVDRPEITASGASVVIGFGGASADYAVYVHEDPNATHAPPTQYKFLEVTALSHQRDLDKRLATHLELVI